MITKKNLFLISSGWSKFTFSVTLLHPEDILFDFFFVKTYLTSFLKYDFTECRSFFIKNLKNALSLSSEIDHHSYNCSFVCNVLFKNYFIPTCQYLDHNVSQSGLHGIYPTQNFQKLLICSCLPHEIWQIFSNFFQACFLPSLLLSSLLLELCLHIC